MGSKDRIDNDYQLEKWGEERSDGNSLSCFFIQVSYNRYYRGTSYQTETPNFFKSGKLYNPHTLS